MRHYLSLQRTFHFSILIPHFKVDQVEDRLCIMQRASLKLYFTLIPYFLFAIKLIGKNYNFILIYNCFILLLS